MAEIGYLFTKPFPSSSGQAARLHFSASLADRWDHVTECWSTGWWVRVICKPADNGHFSLPVDSKALGDGRAVRWKEPESLNDCTEQSLSATSTLHSDPRGSKPGFMANTMTALDSNAGYQASESNSGYRSDVLCIH